MRNRGALFLIVVLILLGGCARSKITTEIGPDGSWSRTGAFTGPEKQEGGMQMGSSLEETFALPSGNGWTSRVEKKDSERTVTLERRFAAGATLKGDLAIKESAPGKFTVSNEVSVTHPAPRRFEYKELIRWTGAPPKSVDPKPEDLAQLKAALPSALATDENARALGAKAMVLAVPLLFGPGDPLLAIGVLHPEYAARRAGQRIGTLLLKALEEQFGDKLTLAQCRDIARKLIETSFSSARPAKPDPTAGPTEKGSGLVPLTFIVKAPGRVVFTNGEVDQLTGEVYWALFPEAASLQPVTLSAVFELDAK